MEFNFYTILAIIGLLAIILGTLLVSSSKQIRRHYTYPLLILGGICLEVYSIHIQDKVFVILQGIFIISSIYGLIKINEHRNKLDTFPKEKIKEK